MSYQPVIDQIEPLLSICVKMADRQDLDEIRISKSRAKEILILIKSLKKPKLKMKPEPKWLSCPF